MRVLNPLRSSVPFVVASLLTVAAFAQNPGWRRVGDPEPVQSADPSTPVAEVDRDTPPPTEPVAGIPARIMIPAGKFLTVRVNQPLSSSHNQVGDFFTATLAEPIVIDGIVVAQRGQTVSGRVSQVDKGGHLSNTAKLGVQLTELTAIDGQQVPIQTEFVGRSGHDNTGRDVGTVATTTGVGAVIGAAADWGRGAAIGAGVGAAAGLAGVLLSHGSPAVIYPETLLSFRIQAPASISTDRAPQAFRYVDPNEYRDQPVVQAAAPPRPAPYPAYGPAPYPYPYPYAYGYPYPYWGPGVGVGVVIGRPYYYRGGYHRFRR